IDSATSYATNAKEGANNEFSMFVETKLDAYLPSLANYIEFEKISEENSKDKIIFTGKSILEKRDDIGKIQIYYDNEKIDLVDFPENIEIYNIYTREKIEA
ncbi:MAG: CRISPR-associated protein, partial [Anaerococcus hydrogenalis]|nr:CRISPR-associated protein [Anaerococcus hydrogenalis]